MHRQSYLLEPRSERRRPVTFRPRTATRWQIRSRLRVAEQVLAAGHTGYQASEAVTPPPPFISTNAQEASE